MAISRKEFLFSALALAGTGVVGTGCGSDDPASDGTGATGGASGSGGKSGSGGSSGSSGASGSGGSAGSSGTSGSSGSSGSGGTSGSGGGVSGSGGTSGSGGGVSGSGGTSGSGGGVSGSGGTSGSGGAAGTGGGNDACGNGAQDTMVSSQHPTPHHVMIPASDVADGTERTYTLSGDHPHDITLTAAHFAMLRSGSSVTVESTEDGFGPHSHTVTVSCA